MRKAAELTEAQKAERRAKHAAQMREWLANLPPEKREAINAKRRGKSKRAAEMTPEELERGRKSAREYMRRKLASLTPEEKAAYLAKRRESEVPRQRELRAADESYREKAKAYATGYYWSNRNKAIATQKVYRQSQKDAILDHYGRFCACCGEDEPVFLSLDHINGDGAAHRRETRKRSGASMYALLIREGFPPGFQVLCFNCNFAKRTGNACPHAEIVKTRLTSNGTASLRRTF